MNTGRHYIKSWWGEKSLAAPGNWTHISMVPSFQSNTLRPKLYCPFVWVFLVCIKTLSLCNGQCWTSWMWLLECLMYQQFYPCGFLGHCKCDKYQTPEGTYYWALPVHATSQWPWLCFMVTKLRVFQYFCILFRLNFMWFVIYTN